MKLNAKIIKTLNNWNNTTFVVKMRNADGSRCTGRIAEIDNRYLEVIFRNRHGAYISIDNITYIAPTKVQPEVVV